MMKDITIISLSMFQPQLFMTVKYNNNNISKVAYISNKIYISTFYYIFICIYHIHTLWLLFVLIGRKQKYVMIGCSNILLLNWEAMWFSYFVRSASHIIRWELGFVTNFTQFDLLFKSLKKIVLICHLVI
jgi:hypothetical protein